MTEEQQDSMVHNVIRYLRERYKEVIYDKVFVTQYHLYNLGPAIKVIRVHKNKITYQIYHLDGKDLIGSGTITFSSLIWKDEEILYTKTL